jgi:DNA polymerase-4
MDRHIACFEIPSLEIALARLTHPALRDRPVGIVSSPHPRASLIDVSKEGQRDGLRLGLPRDEAHRRCPSMQVLLHDQRRVAQGHALLQDAAAQYAPIWEPIRPGHLFLDLTGTTRLFGRAVETAVRLQREVKQRHGLTGVAGVATNKLVSRVAASMVRPAEVCDVQRGSESAFVAPVFITGIPGLDGSRAKEGLQILYDLNIQTLGHLASIAVPHLELAVGPLADLLHAWSHGVDPSPVWPITERPTFQVASAVEPPEIDEPTLWSHVARLMERLAKTLREQQRVAARLRLMLEHSDGDEVAKQQIIPTPTYWEFDLEPVLRTLLRRGLQRRVRVKHLMLLADRLGPPDQQAALFEPDRSEDQTRMRRERLLVALDAIRDRFGEDSVWWGRAQRCRQS